ncbi:hypothetical protein P3X46_017488 [Hevea brasiliensis]|uniref:Protein kinase domain-containing protein n=1 Tax=Hevea brasiliensis TaxID=3981 RepID=A0ABQ9LRR5_HEVBR|nr:wall-associated receptor kinase-like 1 [Hevea brasiliensis]KAJ9169281.1 hypothetical protein P3X46_017488 [Hevea brasiliensis]
MGLSSFCSFSIFILFLILQSSDCQQEYISTLSLDCSKNSSISKGYVCNGNQIPCQSFLTLFSRRPYDSPITISNLLGSEASSIALINNVSSIFTFPSEKSTIVPVSCSCAQGFYQHNTSYFIQDQSETFFTVANNTYQGLTTCQAIMDQNSQLSARPDLSVGSKLTVPLRCACPSTNQTAEGVISLLVYTVTWGETISSIAQRFGVDEASVLEANKLSQEGNIYPFTPILVPLANENHLINAGNSANPRNSANPGNSTNLGNFSCLYANGSVPVGGAEDIYCRVQNKKFPTKLVAVLGVGIGVGLLCLFIFAYKLYQFLKKRRYRIRKARLFVQNGGLLLQQRLSSYGSSEKAKLFTAEELQRATDNYNQSRFLGQGGFGTVYKGMLPDGSIVAVKRSKTIDRREIEQFINEVVILSQINHRNIVKFLGCCLESEFPLLVYEFISNGTLSQHIHAQDQESSLPWEDRFRIASEVAGAVAYMHSAASFPIFHRDIKSSNILLDDKYSAKVSDFGTSRLISYDKTHITTIVQGTFGYLDPEYFYTSQFTDKSDVYSFGVVLIELLSGEKPISSTRAEDEKNLVAHFVSLAEENCLHKILDPRVAREAKPELANAVAELAMKCVRSNAKNRPSMREVAMELDGMIKSQHCLEIDQEHLVRDEEDSSTSETDSKFGEDDVAISEEMGTVCI